MGSVRHTIVLNCSDIYLGKSKPPNNCHKLRFLRFMFLHYILFPFNLGADILL
jgi:hypothetical protein